MFELLNIGLDMQKRMIDAHMQGLTAARDILDAADQSIRANADATSAGKAQIDAARNWMRLWGWRG